MNPRPPRSVTLYWSAGNLCFAPAIGYKPVRYVPAVKWPKGLRATLLDAQRRLDAFSSEATDVDVTLTRADLRALLGGG